MPTSTFKLLRENGFTTNANGPSQKLRLHTWVHERPEKRRILLFICGRRARLKGGGDGREAERESSWREGSDNPYESLTPCAVYDDTDTLTRCHLALDSCICQSFSSTPVLCLYSTARTHSRYQKLILVHSVSRDKEVRQVAVQPLQCLVLAVGHVPAAPILPPVTLHLLLASIERPPPAFCPSRRSSLTGASVPDPISPARIPLLPPPAGDLSHVSPLEAAQAVHTSGGRSTELLANN